MKARIPLLFVGVAALSACDRSGLQYVPDSVEGFPGIVHLGELDVVPAAETDADGRATSWGGDHVSVAKYETLGPAPTGQQGGATATVTGTGGLLCIFVDPEAVYWNQAIATQGANKFYKWPDNARDDGDVDLSVGLAGYYNGTPGAEIGDFEQVYEDSLGTETTIEYNECTMTTAYGWVGSHAGRGAPEYCEIDTSLHPDRSYMILLNTFSVPLDDFTLDYAVNVYDLGEANVEQPSTCATVLSALNAGGLKDEMLLPAETEANNFPDFEYIFSLNHQSYFCECTSALSAENVGCQKLEAAGWSVDYDGAQATYGDFTTVLDFPYQCGDYDPDAFAESVDEEEE